MREPFFMSHRNHGKHRFLLTAYKSLRVQGVQEFEDIRENLKFFLLYSQKFVILQP